MGKDKTVIDISPPSEPEVYTEIYEEDLDIKTENCDLNDDSNNIQIEHTYTKLSPMGDSEVKTEQYVDDLQDDIPYEEEEFELHDDFIYEEDIKKENLDFAETRKETDKEPRENTVSAIKIS